MIGDGRGTHDPAAVLYPEISDELEAADDPLVLTGQSHDSRTVWQVTGTAPMEDAAAAQGSEEHDKLIGVYLPSSSHPPLETGSEAVYSEIGVPFQLVDYPHLLLTSNSGALEASVRADEDPVSIVVEEIDPTRLMVRVEDGPTPLGELREKKVAIVGVGSGGALVADYLAKSGVQNLVLIDDDLFETHNIVRHVCGMEALGRHKVDAVADHLHNRLPNINVERIRSKFELGSANDIEKFRSALSDVDLIVSASAEHSTNNLLDSFVQERLDEPVPVLYAGMFPNLNGGILIRVDPRVSDRCYHCIYSGTDVGGRPDEDADEPDADETPEQTAPRPMPADADVPYDRETEEEASEPGLGLDVDNLTVFVAKMALHTLLRGTNHGLFDMEQSVYTWGNRDMRRAPFKPGNPDSQLYGLELTYVPEERLPQRENCPFCAETGPEDI